jgi:preprotein translocase subunit SecE
MEVIMAEDVKLSKAGNARKNFVRFFKDIRSELKKVIWPTRSQLINNTITVIAVCFIIGGIIWVFDVGLDVMVKTFLTQKG